jgi:death-on-curing protein
MPTCSRWLRPYLFHIAKNHAFLDGNKRTALVAALVFLDINGVSLERDDERLYELTMAAAEGRADKQRLADQLRKLADEAQA